MIGGSDKVIPVRGERPEVLKAAVEFIKRGWPFAVIRDATTDELHLAMRSVPWDTVDELFVFKNADADEAWGRDGATSENADTMVHLIFRSGELTVVHDDASPQMRAMVGSLVRMLNDLSDKAVPDLAPALPSA